MMSHTLLFTVQVCTGSVICHVRWQSGQEREAAEWNCWDW